ncbi:myomegalin-like isoform X2 [Stylophora pistillata]|uniref:myomegalin-like isoform X2 n=1 Tax=Stylophora pistillata TaxID=50429 RepID=UPI000C056B03|nr:myomegalin-like isoform X2 [Stylophora pistillata]
MDSVAEDDVTLPLDFDRSTNLARFSEAVVAGTGGNMLDSSADFSEGLTVKPTTTANQDSAGSPQTKTMKDYEYQISELKKENFGLKLRIYFLEERVNHGGDVPEDIFKANIELKVTVEKLKKELVERQELLVKASNAVEALAQHSDSQIKQLTEEHNEELREIREGYELKLKEMEQELAVAKNELEDTTDKLAETTNLNQQLNDKLLESTDGFHDDQQQMQVAMKATLDEKDRMIDDLRGSLASAQAENKDLKDNLDNLKDIQTQLEQNIPQSLEINEKQILECQRRIKQLTEELENKNHKLEELKEKAKKTERTNRELRNQLHDKEREEHLNSRNSTDNSLSQSQKEGSRDSELQHLQTKVQDLNESLTATREAAHTAKRKWYQAFEEHSEVLKARDAMIAALQSSLSGKDLDLEKLIQSLSSKEVELQRLNNGKLLLENRLDEVLKQKEREQAELMEKHRALSQEHYSKMDALEEAYQHVTAGAQEQLDAKDRLIQKLAVNNKEKDNLIADFIEALKGSGMDDSVVQGSTDDQENLLKKLTNYTKEKDRALQVAAEEKVRALQGKEAELQQLRQALRERDRLIEKINTAVLESQEKNKLLERTSKERNEALQKTMSSLEEQLKGKKGDLETKEASLKEKELVIQKLKHTLNHREEELKELKDFVKNALSSPDEDESLSDEVKKAQEISELLKEKEKLLEDMFQERARLSSTNEANTQRLMAALRDKETALKEAAADLTRVQTEKNSSIQTLQQLLSNKEHEVQALENSKAWASQENEKLINKLKLTAQDKDKTIAGLVESGREKDKMLKALQDSSKSSPKAPSPAEVAELRRNIGLLQAEVRKKDESLKKLESDYRNNLRKLQGDDQENKLKFENLQHEIQTRDAVLKQAKGTIDNLRSRLQSIPNLEDLKQKFAEQSQALAEAQKGKEQALVDSAALKKSNLELEAELKVKLNNIEMLNEAAQMKDRIIKEMQEDQQKQLKDMKENIGYYQKKAQELEASKSSLQQQLMDTEDMKNSLEQQLESYKRRLNDQASYGEEEVNLLRQEVTNLKARLQRAGTPRRESPGVGAGADEQRPDVAQLQQLLEAQIAETKRLNDILNTEHALYGNLVHVVQDAKRGEISHESNLKDEMQALKLLRAQLEEGIHLNDSLRAQLHEKLASGKTTSPHPGPPYDAAYQREIQELKSRLEDSERWNASLQARLNDLQSRMGGVGGSDGEGSPLKVQRLEQQVEKMMEQLKQRSQLNVRLKNQLDDINTLHMQTLAEKDDVITDLTRQIDSLQTQLDNTTQTFSELEKRLQDANSRLEYYATSLNGSHDDTLLEREQELEILKHEVDELRRLQARDDRIGLDMAAQTSPLKDWTQGSSDELRDLERRLEESAQTNEQYKNILEEKDFELQQIKAREASRDIENSKAKEREMAEIQRLREEYLTGIKTNEELKKALENEREKNRDRSRTSDGVLELRLQLDESLQKNEDLQRQLHESARSEDEVDRLRHELQNATQINESLGSQIREFNESFSKIKGVRADAVKMQKELRDAQRLNKTLTDQLKETRKSAEEVGRVQRELREAKMMNDQLGKQLSEHLNHSAKMKSQIEKLQHELQEKDKVIETLQLRLKSKPEMQSIALSPFSSPSRRFVETQTSPRLAAAASLRGTRESSPQSNSLFEANEKLQQMNRVLLGENHLLKSKLKDSEKLNETLRNENDMFSRLHNQSTETQATSQKRSTMDDLLAGFMAEMRELRLRLEDSIRTNDALRAQLEMRLSEGTDDGSAASGPDQIILIRENDSLRTELVEKDRANEKLKRTIDGLKREQTRDKEQLDLLRQQMLESTKVAENLRKELSVYEKLYKLSYEGKNIEVQTDGQSYGSEGPRSPNSESQQDALSMLLAEIRSLRIQLEKSIETNNALRLRLEEQLSRPTSSPSQSPSRSQVTVIRQLDFSEGKGGESRSTVESGRDLENGTICTEKPQVLNQLEEKLNSINKVATEAYNSVISTSQTDVLPYIENILRIILQCKALLKVLHVETSCQRTHSGSEDADKENESLNFEIGKLRRRLLIQEDIIKRACERLETTNKVKESTRDEIIEHLSISQKVLSGARGKLENRVRSRKTTK